MPPAIEVGDWLRSLGLAQYEATFREHEISTEVLPELIESDLEKLGIPLGHRKLLLKAIRALAPPQPTTKPVAIAPPRLPAPDTSHLAERRQLTVMFCDLVGSTELSARLDPEDLREVIGAYHRACAEVIQRAGGFVAKYLGDGVLAYFGYPAAHEDDPEEAIRAALALIKEVGGLSDRHALRVRIGIATGLVVVGDLLGTGAAQEEAVVGETPNLAARLQALAEPNSIVISDSTRRQIGAFFEIHDLGQLALKGFAELQRAWRVLSENRALGRFEALRSRATPLIGRDEEIELLLRRWAQAKAGSGRVALICGEPGVGKSRLAEALAERIADEPHIRLRYFCSPHHTDSAFYPVVAQMERAAGFAHRDSPAERLAKLRSLLDATSPSSEDLALIAELHSLRFTDPAPSFDVTPQRKKEKTFEALVRQVEGLARQQPVLMVFEDIHWIDASSRELLDRTMERVTNWPVLVVATFRPEFQPPWIGQPHVTMLALTRLDRGDTAAMVTHIAGNAALPADVVQEIAERTDGVPLFIEELTNAVLESGAQAALSAVPYPALSVPATLHASLMARLDRLGPASKSVAQIGAAIGREFGHELLASVAGLPEHELREGLDRLTGSGLLFARGTPPQSLYIFKHALVQDAAYGTLLRARRQQLHARIAVTLEDSFTVMAENQPELLAHHFTEAGETARAVGYWLKAGKQALDRSGLAEAETVLRKGLTVATKLPEGGSRSERELDLHIALGQALFASQGYGAPRAGEAYANARRICDQLGFETRLPAVLFGQWLHSSIRGDLNVAAHIAAEIRHRGEERGDQIAEVTGYRASGATHLFRGEFGLARSCLERGLALYDPSERPAYAEISRQDARVVQLGYLSIVLVCTGYLEQAKRNRETALVEARRIAHAHTLAFSLAQTCNAGWLDRTGPEVLLRFADELLALSGEAGFVYFRDVAFVHRGWCHVALGHVDQGLSLLKTGVTGARASGDLVDMPSKLNIWADACRIAHQPQVGLAHVAEAARVAEVTGMREHEAFRLCLRGYLLMQIGDRVTAEDSFRYACALAQRQDAKLLELRSAIGLARLWRDQGKIADARALLGPIYDWFTEGFDLPDLIEAKALLNELAGQKHSEMPESATAVLGGRSSG